MEVLRSMFDTALGRKVEHGPSPVEKLPQDVLVLILQSIDSLRSLRAAVLASSAMYDAFRTAKIETLACIVAHSRPEIVRSEAVALSVVMHMQNASNAKVAKALLIHNLWHTKKELWVCLPKSLSYPHLLHFHWFVEYFTEKLFKSSMRHVYEKGWLGSDKLRFRRLSNNETTRIQRALYRLEFFNSYLVRANPEEPTDLIGSPYWRRRVPVWEMEEIACVQNLLYHRLTVLDDMIQSLVHRVILPAYPSESGVPRSKEFIKVLTRNTKCQILSQDLGTLFRILSQPQSQNTQRTVRQILEIGIQQSRKTWKNPILHFGLDMKSSIPHLMFGGRDSEQPLALHIEKLRAPQEDIQYPSFGYVRAYRTITLELVRTGHMSRKVSSLYNEKKYLEDRKWGYCLWDKDRMEYWGDNFVLLVKKQCQASSTPRASPGWTITQLNA